MLVALGLAFSLVGTKTVDLYRGAPIPYSSVHYWGVTDTTLDSQNPDAPLGGEFELAGGPGKTILIRFADLGSVLGIDRIATASLKLTVIDGEASLASAAIVRKRWDEGPIIALAQIFAKPSEAQQKPSIVQGATWKSSWVGRETVKWSVPGARGAEDATEINGATMRSLGDGQVEIDGLAEAFRDGPDGEAYGLTLTFNKPIDFVSSEGDFGKRPTLELGREISDVPVGALLCVASIVRDGATWVAHVANVGKATSSPFSLSWSEDGRKGTTQAGAALDPGQELTFSVSAGAPRSELDQRDGTLTASISCPPSEMYPCWSTLTIFTDATPVVFQTIGELGPVRSALEWQMVVRFVNEQLFPMSRFASAREGVNRRVRFQGLIADAGPGVVGAYEPADRAICRLLGAPELGPGVGSRTPSAYPGAMGDGDTRCDALIPAAVSLIPEPFLTPLLQTAHPEATGLLDVATVGLLNSASVTGEPPSWRFPKVVLLRLMNLQGDAAEGASVSVFGENDDKPVLTATSDKNGVIEFPRATLQSLSIANAKAAFRVTARLGGGAEATAWLPVWRMAGEFYRGNKAAAVLDLRFDLPDGAIDSSTNLAKGKLVASSDDQPEAALSAMVDEDPTTNVELSGNAGSWIEVDLGRDRAVGEIDLQFPKGEFWRDYAIVTYQTGQEPTDALVWLRDIDSRYSVAAWGSGDQIATLPIFARPRRARYIRIVNKADGPKAKLTELTVRLSAPPAGSSNSP